MMWLNIALVAAILCQCSCEDVDCNNMFPDTLYGQVECIQEETESENEEVTSCDIVDARNITWTVVNTKSGTVAVEFNLMPRSCGFELYRLDLFVDEKVTNAGECDSETDFQSLHSTRYMKILKTEAGNKTEVSSCGRTAAVKFNYIFSGCYLLEIGQIHDSVASMRMFIETEYKKVLLTQKIPRITNQYTTALSENLDCGLLGYDTMEFVDGYQHLGGALALKMEVISSSTQWWRELECSVSNISRINVTRMGLEIRKCDFQSCICGHGIMQHSWEIALSTSGQYMCKVKSGMDKPLCHIGNDEIRCTIQNVTTGFYCVLVEIVDDRCEPYTVWNNNSYCRYNSKVFEVNATLPQSLQTPPTPPPSQAPVDVLLVTVFVVLVLTCVVVILLVWRSKRRRASSEPGQSPYVENQALPLRPRILLMYSRDCKPFMNMMTTFREMLKQVTKCEVYDCFDPLIEEDLSQSKTDWVITHITSPEVKVVVVESKCAVLHQMALIQHMKIIYKEPTWLDDLFSYGLRVLREDLQKNTYGRVFVVRINGFTEENDNLCHITPYTRYVVPQNTEKLLSSLYQQSSLEYVLILNENTDSSIQKLQEDIRTLQIFKQQNRDYLNELFEKNIK